MKRSGLIALIVFFASIILLALISGILAYTTYNSLKISDQKVKKVWSNVETNYQRRTDLYSSVIKTIEGSANFEKSTLKDVMEARSKATSIKVDINDQASLEAYQRAQANLQGTFSRLLAVAESYPDLKTTAAFRDFQTQIEGTENRINIARQDYNSTIEAYNLIGATFPRNIFANMFGYKEKAYFKSEVGSEKAPDINFNIK